MKKYLIAALLASVSFTATAAEIEVVVDKSRQNMIVSVDHVPTYNWKVSTGAPGYDTPSGKFQASSMNEVWYSKQFDDAPMPHSIFFTKKGHAIHGSLDIKHLGQAVSHGCVRLHPDNATKLYKLVEDNGLDHTTVEIGGEEQAPIKVPQVNKRPQRIPREDYYPPRYYQPPRQYYRPPQFYFYVPGVPRVMQDIPLGRLFGY